MTPGWAPLSSPFPGDGMPLSYHLHGVAVTTVLGDYVIIGSELPVHTNTSLPGRLLVAPPSRQLPQGSFQAAPPATQAPSIPLFRRSGASLLPSTNLSHEATVVSLGQQLLGLTGF